MWEGACRTKEGRVKVGKVREIRAVLRECEEEARRSTYRLAWAGGEVSDVCAGV